jgi:dihydrofolate synthase/folylpolyglutamate synthase
MKSSSCFKTALAYLYSSEDYEKTVPPKYDRKHYDLTRFRKLLAKLDDPHKSLRTILVAGTKGKGSTAVLISSILTAAGFRTGLYTSPHLVSVRERIRINNRLISRSDFARIVLEIQALLRQERVADYQTVFEILTAAAFLYFARRRVDIAVIEAGVGGRLDATNVLVPLVSVITPVSIDHSDLLGKSLSKIAREKGGIIKPHGVTVIGDQPPSARAVLVHMARDRKSALCSAPKCFTVMNLRVSDEGSIFDVEGKYRNISLPLRGVHQVANTITALGVIEQLRERYGYGISDKAVYRGIRRVSWPGRLEVAAKRPTVVLDGAHNVASARALKVSLNSIFRFKKLILVLGISANKDIAGIIKELVPSASTVIVTKADHARGADPAVLAASCRKYLRKNIMVEPDPKKAYECAAAAAGKDDLVCVAGSLYLVGAVKKIAGARE